MSTQNALQLASTIQTKVGASLISAQNLLPRDESAGVITQAGASSLGVFLLKDLYDMQQRTFRCVEKVATILQSQLDLAEEAERRERDQAAELAKENKPKGFIGPPVPDSGLDTSKLEDAMDASKLSSLLTAGLTTALVSGKILKDFGKNLGKKLLKGTMYAAIAGFIADPIINYVENEFDLDLTDEAKKEIKLSMVGAAAGFGLAGIPGAIIGATAPMIGKVASYISGNINADEISEKDFLATGLTGTALGYWGTGKLFKLMAASKYPAVTSIGTALGATPVMIAVGAGIAVGVGAAYIANKIDQYQEMALDKLDKTTQKLDREMGEWAAREEEGLFERFGMNLGQLSALGEAQVAAAEANEQAGQNIERFTADTATQTKLTALVDTIANYSDDALKTILTDNTKASNFFSTVESLKAVAAKGGFGEESGVIFTKLASFSDRVQNYAQKLVDQGVTGGKVSAAARNIVGIGGDQLENIPQLEQEKLATEKELQIKRLELEQAKKDLEDAQTRNTGFFDTKEVNDLQEKIRVLTLQVGSENREGSLERKIEMIDRRLQKFGTTNGLLYNLDQLREIMSDKELSDLIQRSVNQQGGEFLQEQNAANNRESAMVNNVIVEGSSSQTTIGGKTENYIAKLNTSSDFYFDREAYRYGAV